MKRLFRGEQIHNNCTDYRRIREIFLTRKMYHKNMRYIKYVNSNNEALVKQGYNYEMRKSNHRTKINNTIKNLNTRIDEIETNRFI